MTRATRPVLAGLVLLFLSGCSRCGKGAEPTGGASELTKQLPRDVDAALVVPNLAELGQRLTLLEQLKIASFVAQLQGLPNSKAWADGFVGQLGIDIRSPEAMKKAGLAPERGLAVALLPSGDLFSVLGVGDAKAWEATVTKLASARLGAGVRSESDVGGKKQLLFSRAQGSAPLLGVVMLDGYALIAAQGSAARVATFVKPGGTPSLADAGPLSVALGRLEGKKDVWAYLPAGSSLGRRYTLSGALLALELSPQAFTLRADLPWPNNTSALEVLVAKSDAAKLVPKLPADAFAMVRYSGDPSLLGPWVPQLAGASVSRAIRETGFDVQGELLDNLKPGMVAAVALAPAPPLGAGMPQLDLRRTNPFRYVHLTGFAQVKDAAKAQASLEKIPPLAKRFGATLTPEDRGGQKVFVTSYSQGEGVHLALKGDTLYAASPLANLDAALAKGDKPSVGGGGGGVNASLQQALESKPLVVAVDLHQFAESVRALPDEAWGIGGSLMKAPAVRWLEATDDLRAVTLSAWAQDKAVQAELSLRLATK